MIKFKLNNIQLETPQGVTVNGNSIISIEQTGIVWRESKISFMVTAYINAAAEADNKEPFFLLMLPTPLSCTVADIMDINTWKVAIKQTIEAVIGENTLTDI